MKQRVFIIHGWDDNPHKGWFPWLKKKLEAAEIEVHVPAMPDADHPTIETWVPFLRRVVGEPNGQTFFIGHSIGCQTILRYLETLPAGTKVGGVVLVAGWVRLKQAATEDEVSLAVATPWIQRPLHWPKIRSHAKHFTAIMSDDDPYVPVEDAKVFHRELNAELIMEHHKRHISGEDGVTVLASAWRVMENMLQSR